MLLAESMVLPPPRPTTKSHLFSFATRAPLLDVLGDGVWLDLIVDDRLGPVVAEQPGDPVEISVFPHRAGSANDNERLLSGKERRRTQFIELPASEQNPRRHIKTEIQIHSASLARTEDAIFVCPPS